MTLKAFTATFVIALKNILSLTHILIKRNHQILKKFLYDMKQMLLNRLSLIGKSQYLLSFPPAKQ